MAYVCELGIGQRIYAANQGTQTIVTAASGSPGQQQQSSCGFQTGTWTTPPELFQTPSGALLKVTTAQGDTFIQIQGSSIGVVRGAPFGSLEQMQMHQTESVPGSPMKPMEPMQPMEPMKLGNMQMNMNPMEMRMGNMEMQMGSPPSASASSSGTQHFCSQCGNAVKLGDRFCSNCGHNLER